MARIYMNDKVEKYVMNRLTRKKILDKRKLYHNCMKDIPICKHMTYNSFASIVKNIPNVKANKKNVWLEKL